MGQDLLPSFCAEERQKRVVPPILEPLEQLDVQLGSCKEMSKTYSVLQMHSQSSNNTANYLGINQVTLASVFIKKIHKSHHAS
jgi:hypothetical protein